ncbi:MAG: hypothetical protein ACK4GJ_05820 [bacterium]
MEVRGTEMNSEAYFKSVTDAKLYVIENFKEFLQINEDQIFEITMKSLLKVFLYTWMIDRFIEILESYKWPLLYLNGVTPVRDIRLLIRTIYDEDLIRDLFDMALGFYNENFDPKEYVA